MLVFWVRKPRGEFVRCWFVEEPTVGDGGVISTLGREKTMGFNLEFHPNSMKFF